MSGWVRVCPGSGFWGGVHNGCQP